MQKLIAYSEEPSLLSYERRLVGCGGWIFHLSNDVQIIFLFVECVTEYGWADELPEDVSPHIREAMLENPAAKFQDIRLAPGQIMLVQGDEIIAAIWVGDDHRDGSRAGGSRRNSIR